MGVELFVKRASWSDRMAGHPKSVMRKVLMVRSELYVDGSITVQSSTGNGKHRAGIPEHAGNRGVWEIQVDGSRMVRCVGPDTEKIRNQIEKCATMKKRSIPRELPELESER